MLWILRFGIDIVISPGSLQCFLRVGFLKQIYFISLSRFPTRTIFCSVCLRTSWNVHLCCFDSINVASIFLPYEYFWLRVNDWKRFAWLNWVLQQISSKLFVLEFKSAFKHFCKSVVCNFRWGSTTFLFMNTETARMP